MVIFYILVVKGVVEKSGFYKYEKVGIIEKVDRFILWSSNKIIREIFRKVGICIVFS